MYGILRKKTTNRIYLFCRKGMEQELIKKIKENTITCESNNPITTYQYISIKIDIN